MIEKLEAYSLLAFLLSDKTMRHNKTGDLITKKSEIRGHAISLDHLLNSVQNEKHFTPKNYRNSKMSEVNYKLACKCLDVLFTHNKITKKQCLRFLAIAEIKLRPFKNTRPSIKPAQKAVKASSKHGKRKILMKEDQRVDALKGEAMRSNTTAIGRPKIKGSGKSLI